MSAPRSLQDFLAAFDLTQASYKSQILLVAYYMRLAGVIEFSATELAEQFRQGFLAPPDHLSTRLSQLAKGKVAPLLRITAGRYSLSIHGIKDVETFIKTKPGTTAATRYLEKLVGRLKESTHRRFLAEAAACLEIGARRAAVVMTWLLTLDHLQEYILTHKLSDFNAALKKRTDVKSLQIASKDDFSDLKESILIETARSARVISGDVRKILDEKLGFRNTCAHPSDIEVHDTKVINFVEDLVENVMLKFPI